MVKEILKILKILLLHRFFIYQGGNRLDIRQLRYFIAIAEEKQITAAAKRLHMTQPPLSQQLSSMEEKLGVELFSRNGRYLELTDAGDALYRNAINIDKHSIFINVTYINLKQIVKRLSVKALCS